MSPQTAQRIFIVFIIFSVIAVTYTAYDFVHIIFSIKLNEQIIPFDSGTYYLLLMSVFWILGFIQFTGLKNNNAKILKYANQLLVFWFVFMLILANLIPYYLTVLLEDSGYTKCRDPHEISRISKGESSLYMKGKCQ